MSDGAARPRERREDGWLVRDGRVLASLEIAAGWRDRLRGLLGRDDLEGGLVLEGTRSVHTFGMSFDLDVAFIDRDGMVVRTLFLPRNRVTLPVWRSRYVLEAVAGSFRDWDLQIGDRVEITHRDQS